MANSYLVKRPLKITRQEGDTGSVVFIVPDTIPMTGKTATFAVVSKTGVPIFTKTGGQITVDTQTITVPLVANDTKTWQGVHFWELQVTSLTEVITLGRGDFEIINELIST